MDTLSPSQSAQSTTTSRRASQAMGPPVAPPHPHRSPIISSNEQTGVPLRHPRPLTAAELYLECEKEQEAVVNRLTRELTALRAQSASVASNSSHSSVSTSASLLPVDIGDPNPTHQMTGATHPTPSRRHRSSSSVSTRSNTNINTPATSTPSLSSSVTNISNQTNHSNQAQAGSATGNNPVGHGVSQASHDRAAAAHTRPSASLSRQPSVSASGRSTPARQSLDIARGPSVGSVPTTSGTLFTLPHRPSISRDASYASQTSLAAQAGTPVAPTSFTGLPSPAAQSSSMSVNAAMQHYADTAAYRTEMEIVKAENDALRQRVRNLERALRSRRRDSSQSDAQGRPSRDRDSLGADATSRNSAAQGMTSPGAGVAAWAAGGGGVGGVAGPRERSESQSTTASSRRGGGGGVTGLGEEDVVRFGESAGSIGIGRGA